MEGGHLIGGCLIEVRLYIQIFKKIQQSVDWCLKGTAKVHAHVLTISSGGKIGSCVGSKGKNLLA